MITVQENMVSYIRAQLVLALVTLNKIRYKLKI
jgi:hypothetical protein